MTNKSELELYLDKMGRAAYLLEPTATQVVENLIQSLRLSMKQRQDAANSVTCSATTVEKWTEEMNTEILETLKGKPNAE